MMESDGSATVKGVAELHTLGKVILHIYAIFVRYWNKHACVLHYYKLLHSLHFVLN